MNIDLNFGISEVKNLGHVRDDFLPAKKTFEKKCDDN